ncbi:hypothetical protein OG723_25685 [Streptomyces sp. NBC_01278]|uniref:hypothetical protein n=1 Tax=Streptomyces sp. NBC_01278 TaxID=2903809 RepID=UPI002E312462|nr:hypothetical protein [Streptomyces sp. NBC_01278]
MRALRTAAAVLLGAVVLAGCGSDGGGDSDGPGGRPPSGGSGTAASAPAQPSPGPSSGGTAAPSGKPTDTAGAPTAPTVPVSPAPSSALERLVTVTRSGGIAGRTSSLLVKGDGSWTRLDAQARPAGTGKLAPDRVAKLRAALGQADFAHLPRVLKGGGTVFDGFFYAFVHGGHEVAADQESLTPHLQDVLDELPPFEAG